MCSWCTAGAPETAAAGNRVCSNFSTVDREHEASARSLHTGVLPILSDGSSSSDQNCRCVILQYNFASCRAEGRHFPVFLTLLPGSFRMKVLQKHSCDRATGKFTIWKGNAQHPSSLCGSQTHMNSRTKSAPYPTLSHIT